MFKLFKSFLIILLLNSLLMAQTNSFDKLYNLYNSKKYFKFIAEFKKEKDNLTPEQQNVFNAFYYTLLNKPGESESYISGIVNSKSSLSYSVKKDLYSISILNNVWLGDYKKAADYSKIVLKNYGTYIKEKEKTDYENSLLIWEAMSGVPKQEVLKKSETKINMKRDMAGLYNIPVTFDDITFDFIFDTGANFSTITESYAKKLDLVFTNGIITADAITGKKIGTKIAWAKSFFIGNIEIKNSLFLVVADEDLSFAGGAYKINGIIGFPIMVALEELSIGRDGELTVPLVSTVSEKRNMVIDGFNPIVDVEYKNNPMCFAFDTGAKTTLLYAPFLNDNKKEIISVYKTEDIKFGGAGGDVKVPGYNLKNIELKVSDAGVILPEVSLLEKKLMDKEEFFYGNLGQDFISKFDTMTLNFKYMSIDFK